MDNLDLKKGVRLGLIGAMILGVSHFLFGGGVSVQSMEYLGGVSLFFTIIGLLSKVAGWVLIIIFFYTFNKKING